MKDIKWNSACFDTLKLSAVIDDEVLSDLNFLFGNEEEDDDEGDEDDLNFLFGREDDNNDEEEDNED